MSRNSGIQVGEWIPSRGADSASFGGHQLLHCFGEIGQRYVYIVLQPLPGFTNGKYVVFAFGSAEKGQLGNGTTGERIMTGNKTVFDVYSDPSGHPFYFLRARLILTRPFDKL